MRGLHTAEIPERECLLLFSGAMAAPAAYVPNVLAAPISDGPQRARSLVIDLATRPHFVRLIVD
jgi:hypothetical protein